MMALNFQTYVEQLKDDLEAQLRNLGSDIDLDVSTVSLFENLSPEERLLSSDWIADWLNSTAQVALLVADGGAGKSTMLRQILVEQAYRYLTGQSSYVPLYAPLHELTGGLAEVPGFLLRHLIDEDDDPEQMLQQYNWLIGLDGITELEHAASQHSAAELVRKFVDRFPKARFVLTSRPTAHLIETFDDADVEIREIQPLTWTQLTEFMTHRLPRSEFERLIYGGGFVSSGDLILFNPLFATLALDIFKQSGSLALTRQELFEQFIALQLESPAFRSAGSWYDNREKVYLGLQTFALQMLRNGKPSLFNIQELEAIFATLVGQDSALLDDLPMLMVSLSHLGIFIEAGAVFLRWRHQKFLEYLAASMMIDIYFDADGLTPNGQSVFQTVLQGDVSTTTLSTRLWRESILTMTGLLQMPAHAASLMKKIILQPDSDPLLAYEVLTMLSKDLQANLREPVIGHIYQFVASDLQIAIEDENKLLNAVSDRVQGLNQLWNLSAWELCVEAIDILLAVLADYHAPELEALLLIMRGRQIFEFDGGINLVVESYQTAREKAIAAGSKYLRKVCDHNIAVHEGFDLNLCNPEPVFQEAVAYFGRQSKKPTTIEEGYAENSLGLVCLFRAQWQAAGRHLERALQATRNYPLEQNRVRMNRAMLYLNRHEYELTLTELAAIYRIFELSAHQQGMCYAKLNEAIVYLVRLYQQPDPNPNYIQKVQAAIEAAYQLNEDIGEDWTFTTLLQLENMLFLKQGRRAEARAKMAQLEEIIETHDEDFLDDISKALASAEIARSLWPDEPEKVKTKLDYAVELLRDYSQSDFEDVSAILQAVEQGKSPVDHAPATTNLLYDYLDIIPQRQFRNELPQVMIEEIADEDDAAWTELDRLMLTLFPANELRPIEALRAEARQKRTPEWPTRVHFWTARIDQLLVGLAMFEFIPRAGFAYIYYLGVDESWRRNGLGGMLLQRVWQHVLNEAKALAVPFRGLIFEVDHPEAASPEVRSIYEARIRFYKEQGALMLPLDYLTPPFWNSPEHKEVLFKIMVKVKAASADVRTDLDFMRDVVIALTCHVTLGDLQQPLDSPYIQKALTTIRMPEPEDRGTLSG